MHAAHLAKMGHQVTAVDPSEAMLEEGQKLYQHSNLTFTVDSLPNLKTLEFAQFDVIYSIAAWQYIDVNDRVRAMIRALGFIKT